MKLTYRVLGKGKVSPSNPYFVQLGKKRRGKGFEHTAIIGEIKKKTITNMVGIPEEKIVIEFTTGSQLTQDDIINEIKTGKIKEVV